MASPARAGDARRLGQIERHDTLAARNSRLAPGDTLTVRVRRFERSGAARAAGIPGSLPEMDARARCAQLDRGKRGARSRLSLVLRLEDVRHLRGAHERPRSAGLLGSGRAGDDDRAAAQSAGHPRSRGRSRAVRAQGRELRAMDRASGALCRLSRAALAQGDEERVEGARLHRLHGCYSACPVIGLGDLTDFAGPAPLVQLGQTALDPRNDPAKVARALAQTGIFNCVSCYKCEEVCPASIPIVSRVIEPLKAQAAALVPAHGEASAGSAPDRGGARPRRSGRARARRAGARGAAQLSAHLADALARQDQSCPHLARRARTAAACRPARTRCWRRRGRTAP